MHGSLVCHPGCSGSLCCRYWGYAVKGEIGACDLVAVRGPDEPPLVVELKLAVTLSLVLQGVDRLALTDLVYLAVPAARAGRASRPRPNVRVTGGHLAQARANLAVMSSSNRP